MDWLEFELEFFDEQEFLDNPELELVFLDELKLRLLDEPEFELEFIIR